MLSLWHFIKQLVRQALFVFLVTESDEAQHPIPLLHLYSLFQEMGRSLTLPPFWVLLVFALSLTTLSSAAFNKPQNRKGSNIGSSIIFQLTGNVYPDGHYLAFVDVGNPPNRYFFDVDTGSDITWMQCNGPCAHCVKAPHAPFQPKKNSIVLCTDPLCAYFPHPEHWKCDNPNKPCAYKVSYADLGSSTGVVIKDVFRLVFANGSIISAPLKFGCGIDQRSSMPMMKIDGVLGLGSGKASVVSQLHDFGVIRRAVGHCMSATGGFLFLGDELVPSSGVAWIPMSNKPSDKHYSSGHADLFFGKTLIVKGLNVIFDSGSTYSYFGAQTYGALLSFLTKDLTYKPILRAPEDNTLSICWKGPKPFKTIQDAKTYFKQHVSLTFGKKSQLVIPPEGYLIISRFGNACLGALNGTEVGLGNANIIGDIMLLDKLMIYHNEKRQIGWIPTDCNRLPNMDRDYVESLIEQYTGSMGVLTEEYSATRDL